jgi:hypothetical protein
MTRLISVFVVCWIAISVWLSWGELVNWFTFGHLFELSVYLSFIYPLFALIPALAIAAVSGHVLKVTWWLRGLLAATVSCSVVLVFLAKTQQFSWSGIFVFSAVGSLLGLSASPSRSGRSN